MIRGTKDYTRKKESSLGKTAERFKKALLVEGLVADYLFAVYGEKFKSQIKIESQLDNDKSLIVDGVLFNEKKIVEVIETRLITAKSFDHMFYVLSNFIKKTVKLGIKIPIKFIIVSEGMDEQSARQINEQIIKLNWTRKLNYSMPKISAEFFKLEEDKLVEINLSKE
jgi:hypothetical protein